MAVALSGGPDSLALTLLLDEWVRDRGGLLYAITVDHGLRPESVAEAVVVRRRLRGTGVRHRILHWGGMKPRSGIQQAAREARYALLSEWCARAGVLHLFVAHHLEDQAETFLLRVGRGSGKNGLAAMSRVVEHRAVRLLRPCLGIERSRLRGVLRASATEAVNDPSNDDRKFARVRLRLQLPALADQGLPAARLAATAETLGRIRSDFEADVAAALAMSTSLHVSGYGLIRPAAFRQLPERVQFAVLEAVLGTIGSRPRPPRRRPLAKLAGALSRSSEVSGDAGWSRQRFRGATLSGCRILWHRGDLLVCREPSAASKETVVEGADDQVLWDGRFHMALHICRKNSGRLRGAVSVGRLGEEGWKEIVGQRPDLRDSVLPWPVRPGLPAVRDREGVLLVPHLAYRRAGICPTDVHLKSLAFRPIRPLAGAGFMLA